MNTIKRILKYIFTCQCVCHEWGIFASCEYCKCKRKTPITTNSTSAKMGNIEIQNLRETIEFLEKESKKVTLLTDGFPEVVSRLSDVAGYEVVFSRLIPRGTIMIGVGDKKMFEPNLKPPKVLS